MNTTITLRQYFGKGKKFVIPKYQRGYIWGKKRFGDGLDSVSYILQKTIVPGFQKDCDIFLQGITVHEANDEIIIIDGQQRTTFFYLLFKWLGYNEPLALHYDIRIESNDFLKSPGFLSDCNENLYEEYQDIYFFKKTIRLILRILADMDKEKLLSYLLDKVKFLYVNLPRPEQATKVFSMMNGNRAVMRPEEVIKAELLRLASRSNEQYITRDFKEQMAQEWDCNLLRSRYAHEWDKWLQWWNKEEVRFIFRCKNVMGYLISTFQDTNNELTFENFKEAFLKTATAVEAKNVFDGLRRLQKRFEDAFNSPEVYNRIGAILRIGKPEDFIKWFFRGEKKPIEALDWYYRCAFLKLTHKEIMEKNDEAFDSKFTNVKEKLENDFAYFDENAKEEVFRLLLRLNIDEDTKQGRKFNFHVWDNRSLEHIYPKSMVFHYDEEQKGWFDGNENPLSAGETELDGYISRDDCKCTDCSTTEHSLGNLVLLYGRNNSEFGKKTFEEKKKMFFQPSAKEIFESRHLLHTIFKFAQSQWGGNEIAMNKYNTLKEFEAYYGK